MDDADQPPEQRRAYFFVLLTDPDPGSRWKAIESLARDGDPAAIDPIIRALDDDDWRVRQKAAWALGYIGDTRALLPLRRAMRGEMESVREMILEAIDEITRKNHG